MCLSALLISSCGGGSGGSKGSGKVERTANGSYLFVTYQSQELGEQSLGENKDQRLYYSNQSVGTSSSYAVRIANRGADIYPLKNISIQAPLFEDQPPPGYQPDDNSEEFSVPVLDGIELGPAEAITVDVSFNPITEGEKNARFVVDFETIIMVDESVNKNEQSYYKASELELSGRYKAANETYADYLANSPVTSNKRRAAIRMPIINEADSYDGREDLGLYLEAMYHRDEKDFNQAIKKLDVFAAMYADSYLADDAQYLKAYIQLIDMNEPVEAMRSLQKLRADHPDTNYYDTSLYSEAIAQIDIGNDMLAVETLETLRTRHTGIDALGVSLPKDNLMSRMWFARTEHILQEIRAKNTTV